MSITIDVEAEELEVAPKLPLIIRSATLETVRFSEREIDVLAMPYGKRSDVEDNYGRYIEEVQRGAFNGIQKRPNRVKVLREHDVNRAVGKARVLHPDNEKGLLACLRISRTPLGDETLELAHDGVLEPSVGARPMQGGDQWSFDRSYVLRTKLYLDEISLLPFGHYAEMGATVLAVRSDAKPLVEVANSNSVTPRLDAYRAALLRDAYAAIDRAHGVQ